MQLRGTCREVSWRVVRAREVSWPVEPDERREECRAVRKRRGRISSHLKLHKTAPFPDRLGLPDCPYPIALIRLALGDWSSLSRFHLHSEFSHSFLSQLDAKDIELEDGGDGEIAGKLPGMAGKLAGNWREIAEE